MDRLIRPLPLTVFICIMYAAGIAGHLYPPTFNLMLALTPWVLLFLGITAFIPFFKEGGVKTVAWVAVTAAVTFGLEALGVATGIVFGHYTYGDTLGFKLLNVPLVIGFNWVLVVAGAATLCARLVKNPLLMVLLAALLCTAFDFVLEPLAMNPAFDYWSWSGGSVPLQNYAAWFVIALVFTVSARIARIPLKSPMPAVYFFIQLAFFALVRLGKGIL